MSSVGHSAVNENIQQVFAVHLIIASGNLASEYVLSKDERVHWKSSYLM